MAVPPPPPPPPRRGPGRGPAAAVLTAAAVVGVMLGTAVAYAAGAFDRGPGSPEDTVRDYYTALREGDCDRILDEVFTRESWSPNGSVSRPDAMEHCQGTFGGVFRPDYVVEETRVISLDGDRAVVEVVRYTNPALREQLDEETREQLDALSDRFGDPSGEPDHTRRFHLRWDDGRWRIHVPEGIGPADEFGGWPVADPGRPVTGYLI